MQHDQEHASVRKSLGCTTSAPSPTCWSRFYSARERELVALIGAASAAWNYSPGVVHDISEPASHARRAALHRMCFVVC